VEIGKKKIGKGKMETEHENFSLESSRDFAFTNFHFLFSIF